MSAQHEPLPVETVTKVVEVYVCPTPDCPDYFGHAAMPDLARKITGDRGMNGEHRPESNHRSRADCPTCFVKGKRVERIRCRVAVTI